jgi:hypothetical protein
MEYRTVVAKELFQFWRWQSELIIEELARKELGSAKNTSRVI